MIADDLAAYLADVARRRKPATAQFYRGRTRWIAAALGAGDWASLSARQVLAALDQANRWPDGSPKAPDTIRGNTIAWQQFERWAIDTGRLEAVIVSKLPVKPAGRQRDRLPTLAELQQLLAAGDPAFGRIYRALILCGARPGELCTATIAEYDQAAGVVVKADHKTVGKTKRARVIPISPACAAELQQAIAGRTEGPIFLRQCGRPWSTQILSRAFRTLRTRLKLDPLLVLYSTRHKFATEVCHASGIEAAAAVLGHAGLQTIKRYVHHNTDQLRDYASSVPPEQLLPPAAGQEP